MVHWKKGKEYPNIEALSDAFRAKRSEMTRNLLMYWGVIVIITAVVFFLAPNPLTIGAGAIALVIAFIYVSGRRRGYTKVAEIIADENFYWTAGKAQNKWKRGIIDLGSRNAYQVGINDEWVECDATTYNTTEIGKAMVLVRKSLEEKDAAIGIVIPEGGGFKQVKKVARNSS